MTAITRRRLVWAITGVEIVLLAWLVFAVHCPARLELERMGAVPPDRLLPAVRGEVIEGDVAGYHYYPDRDLVRGWLVDEGLSVLDEATEPQDGWGYWHLFLGTPAP